MEYTKVIGLDISLTSTGIAVVDRKGNIDVGSFGYGGSKSFTLKEQVTRIEYICQEFGDWIDKDILVVVESPSYGSYGGLIYERGGLWFSLIRMAYAAGAEVATAAPKSRARWATGSGVSDKKEVRAAMVALYPKTKFKNYDESDAATLASMGVHYLWNKDTGNKIRNECLLKVKWPHIEEKEEAE